MIHKNSIPKHVAIIMDGNGRWAKQRNLPRTAGHRVGIDRVEEILNAALEIGIEVITFFAFSTENWLRPKKEVNMLMQALSRFLGRKINKLNKNNIKLKVIGRKEPLPEDLWEKIKDVEEKTKKNSGLLLILALNYGSRYEILDAAKHLATCALKGEVNLDNIDTEGFSQYLYTAGIPDPDLLIRTSGEMRLSNFLLWQLSYAEFYFPKIYWPDFRSEDLKEAIRVYQERKRRFGGIKEV
jgi:undecaprenyl diphosphate synthase